MSKKYMDIVNYHYTNLLKKHGDDSCSKNMATRLNSIYTLTKDHERRIDISNSDEFKIYKIGISDDPMPIHGYHPHNCYCDACDFEGKKSKMDKYIGDYMVLKVQYRGGCVPTYLTGFQVIRDFLKVIHGRDCVVIRDGCTLCVYNKTKIEFVYYACHPMDDVTKAFVNYV